MSDFSINPALGVNGKKETTLKQDAYSALKSEYDKECSKINKSDFANSPVALEKELTHLAKLKETAKKEGLDDELKWIKSREEAIYTKLSNAEKLPDAFYSALPAESVKTSKTSKYLNKVPFDKETFSYNMEQLQKADIDTDAALKIIDILKVENPQTSKYTLDNASIKAITQIKRALVVSRRNERDESANPINKLGTMVLTYENNIMVIKDGKVTYVSPIEGRSVEDLQEEYDNLIAQTEDNLLCEIASEFKNENGVINSKYTRNIIALRMAGITYSNLIELTKRCFSSDGQINKAAMDNIADLKVAGVLSKDIAPILDVCSDRDDIKNAAALTAAVIEGQDVCSFLPLLRNNSEMKEFICNFAELLEDRKYLRQLVEIVKDEKGQVDNNAIDIAYNLFDSSLKPADFVDVVSKIVVAAKNADESQTGDDAAGIVSIMQRSNRTPEEIIAMLEMCKNSDKIIDENLAEIVWDSHVKKMDLDYIYSLIENYKKHD